MVVTEVLRSSPNEVDSPCHMGAAGDGNERTVNLVHGQRRPCETAVRQDEKRL